MVELWTHTYKNRERNVIKIYLCFSRNDAEDMLPGHKILATEEMFDIFDLDNDDKLGAEHTKQ